MSRVLLAAIVLSLCACGARPSPGSILGDRFDTPEARDAEERAPDLFAAASRARRAALSADQAGRRGVAEDHATRARLFLDAAIAEAERISLEEERLVVEARESEADLAHGRAVTEREEILVEVARRESSRVAAQEAAAAFAQATEDEGRRYRGRSEERAALHREAAQVLARRAQLMVAAAEAQGAEAESTAAVSALLERADGENDPSRRLELTEQAVRSALAALGSARRQRPGPTSDERAALIEAAAEAGFSVEQSDRGLTVVVPTVFRGSAAAPTRAGSRRLARLAAIVQAHPHGPVQIHAYGTAAGNAARQRAANARATRAANVVVREGAPQERIGSEGIADAAGEGSVAAVEATFVAYGPAP